MNRALISKRFDRAAKHYNSAATMQQQAAHLLIRMLPKKYWSTILDLGTGTGFITANFLAELQYQHCIAMDFSKASLSIASNHLTHDTTTFVHANFDCFDFTKESAHLIFSNMALHWSSDITKLLEKLAKTLVSDGYLLFSVPLLGSLPELSESHKNHFLTEDNWNHHLAQTRLMTVESASHLFSEPFATQKDALLRLRRTGVNSVYSNQQTSLSKKSWLEEYNRPTTLTFNIGVFLACKTP